jgi:endo-alpha-1,4-polygalactosaminidase (GH114 family)
MVVLPVSINLRMSKTKFFHLMEFQIIAIILSACSHSFNGQNPTGSIITIETPEISLQSYWIPSQSDTFQIQLANYPPDISINTDLFEIDLFETTQGTINALHNSGKKVICYMNVGAWEDFRPDAADFPDEVIGKKYIGWEGERWLNVSEYKSFSNIIRARFDLAEKKGCDGVDADNINGYLQKTGFRISPQDQITYNIWLSNLAHQRNLAIGMKNNGDQITELENYFDFAIIEDCAFYNECDNYLIFTNHGKTVFQIEYTDKVSSLEEFCEPSLKNGFIGILKNRSLDSWIQSCSSQ